MQSKMRSSLQAVLLLSLTAGCSIVGIRGEEEPSYKVLLKNDNKEIREYNPYIIAKTTIDGSYSDAQSDGFKILAGYIFGKNQSKQEIAMTAPVVQRPSEKIAMTAPVVIKGAAGSDSNESQKWTITFSMPSSYTMSTLPTPNDERVILEEVPSRLVAAYKFSGFWGEAKNQRLGNELLEWIKNQDQFEAVSEPAFAGYNPPWTIPFFRRNEILVEIQESAKK